MSEEYFKAKKTERIKGMWRKCYKITFHNQGLTDEDIFGIFLKLTTLHNADLVKVVINDYTSCEVVIKCSLRTRNLLVADFWKKLENIYTISELRRYDSGEYNSFSNVTDYLGTIMYLLDQ